MNDKKAKIAPKIRFPQFKASESWRETTLEQLSERITEKVGTKKLTTLSISAGIGFVSQNDKFSRDISGDQYVNYIRIKKGDFSYNKGNSKKFPQGCVYELHEYEEAAVPNAFISFRFHPDIVSNFYKGYFESNFHGKQLTKHITSGARSNGLLNINSDDFFGIILPTPKESGEQQRIADCIRSLDELIDAEVCKLETLQKYKCGLLQKLFPMQGATAPELRFPEFCHSGNWQFVKLSELAKRINTRNRNAKIHRVLTNSAVNGVIDQDDYFEREIVSQNNLANYCVVEIGDYVYNPRISVSAPVGPISKNKIGQGVMSPLYTVFRFLDDDYDFYEYYFQTPLWHHYIRVKANMGARHDRISISADDFMDMLVPACPDPKEKQRIANFLRNADNLITMQNQKVETLTLHKKGLIQQLYPTFEEVFK